jgi:hypothetical protein
MSLVILLVAGLSMCLVAWSGYGVPTWISRDVLWLGGVIVLCTAFVKEEKRA